MLQVAPRKKGRACLLRPQHAEEAITTVTQGSSVEGLGLCIAFRGEYTRRVDLEAEREKGAMEPKHCGELGPLLTVYLHGNGERRLLIGSAVRMNGVQVRMACRCLGFMLPVKVVTTGEGTDIKKNKCLQAM